MESEEKEEGRKENSVNLIELPTIWRHHQALMCPTHDTSSSLRYDIIRVEEEEEENVSRAS